MKSVLISKIQMCRVKDEDEQAKGWERTRRGRDLIKMRRDLFNTARIQALQAKEDAECMERCGCGEEWKGERSGRAEGSSFHCVSRPIMLS